MNYKPEETALMAYLYGELEGAEKERLEQYLLHNPEARKELEKFQKMRRMLGSVKDKEVIAPPIFMGDSKQRFLWSSPYFKTILSIAASVLLIMVVGKITDTRINYSNHELTIAFGEAKKQPVEIQQPVSSLTSEQVQQMINSSLGHNNSAMQASWQHSQEKLDSSIRANLAVNSDKIDRLVHEASSASKDQIAQYASSIQTENMKVVKDYFQLTSNDQKKYIEDLLVDFAKYLQQQRNDDLKLVQTKLNSLEKNTDIFKQETEQILSSIITNRTNSKGTKN